MFGNFMGKQLEEAKKKAEEAKARLDNVQITGESGGIRVMVTANRVVKSIDLNAAAHMSQQDQEYHLTMAMNDALDQATRIHDVEMATVAQEALPNIPGMNNLFNK